MKRLVDKYGKWVLITGASSGIGKAFAYRLADEGFNLVLAARRIQRLEEIAVDLRNRYKIDIIIVQVDLTKDDFLKIIIDAIGDKEINLLINNAGVGAAGELISIDPQVEVDMIKLNCIAPVELTQHFAKKMMQRKKGGIIFLGSTVANQGTPLMSVYAATKAFNLILGEGLWYEMKQHSVDVLVVNPGGTNTEFQRISDMSSGPFVRESSDVVNTALSALGKKPVIVDGFINKMMAFGSKILPAKTATTIAGAIAGNLHKMKGK